jgi:arabinofuranan 3-O-arabinosyltransferase
VVIGTVALHRARAGLSARTALTAGLYAVAVAVLGAALVYYAVHPDGYDLKVIVAGLERVLHHQPIYSAGGYGRYLYPPSSLVLLAPLGLLGFDRVHLVYMLLEAASIVAAVALSLRLFRVSFRSPLAGGAFAAAALSAPVIDELRWTNVDGLVLSAFVGSVLAMSRRRWLLAGALLGVAIAIKPTVAPIGLLLLLWRQWRAAGLAAAIPVVLMAAGIVLSEGDGWHFFTVSLPILANGLGHDLAGGNVALVAVFDSLRVPHAITWAVRLAALGLVAVTMWRVRTSGWGLTVQVTTLMALILLATYLLSSYSFLRYLMYLLPALVMIVLYDRPLPIVLGLLGLACLTLPYSRGLDLRFSVVAAIDSYRFTIGLVLLLTAIVVAVWTRVGVRPLTGEALNAG